MRTHYQYFLFFCLVNIGSSDTIVTVALNRGVSNFVFVKVLRFSRFLHVNSHSLCNFDINMNPTALRNGLDCIEFGPF